MREGISIEAKRDFDFMAAHGGADFPRPEKCTEALRT
jgi:hypothetical protein